MWPAWLSAMMPCCIVILFSEQSTALGKRFTTNDLVEMNGKFVVEFNLFGATEKHFSSPKLVIH
jgi:hypothetical protein